MKRSIGPMAALAPLLALGVSSTAHADILYGTYQIDQGETPRDQKYTGTVTFLPQGQTVLVHRVTSKGKETGIGLKQGKTVWVAFGKNASIALYRKTGAGISGVWSKPTFDGALGSETGETPDVEPGFEHQYRISGADPSGGSAYTGTLSIEAEMTQFSARWTVGKTEHSGIGAADADIIGIARGKGTRLWVYTDEGNGLRGWMPAIRNEPDAGTESLSEATTVVQFERLAELTCQCTGATCAQGALTAFESLYRRHKDASATKPELTRLEKASASIARCMLQKGVTADQINKALE